MVSPSDVSFHRLLLWGAAAVLLASWILQVRDGRHVVVPYLDVPLPGTCYYRRWLGIDCPGCGLTRCFISAAHGDLAAAWAYHPTGLLLFAAVVWQIPFRAYQIRRLRNNQPEQQFPRLSTLIVWVLVVGLFGQWLLRSVAA